MSKSSKKHKTKDKPKELTLNAGLIANGVLITVLSAGVLSIFQMNERLYDIEKLIQIHEVQEH